ncbi:MAG: M14 family metallopeptidase [Blastocatellia bacterium]|nr:M14 family metallopeptidase [Blastocatellia bacterium]
MTELQKRSPLIRVESFGETVEKRKMPLMILSDSGISTPSEARAAGKPIIFIMGNIHAGEVEGKEAVQHLARRILFGDLKSLLSKLTILLAPIYNADGNEKVDVNNRTAQYGPIAGVGVRENSQKYDLNRDYIKLDSPEAQNLVNLFNRWDPHLTVDLHTTNGSYHAYHLTYSQPLNPNTDQRILDFQRDKMMPTIAKNLLKNHKFRSYYYGNFPGFSNLPKPGEKTSWEAFTHQPRIGQNYVGLRNRLTILSEAYSYLPFKRRIEVTERFVEEIFKYCAANSLQIMQLTKSADDETVRKMSGNEAVDFGVAFKMVALPKPVEILIGAVEKVKNPRNGKDMTVMIEDKITPMKMEDFGMFASTRTVKAPRAYLFKPDSKIVEKLIQHGITVEELTADLNVEVDSFTIATAEKSKRPFQGHNEMKITGKYSQEKINFPVGTILVRTAQPLGRLVFYLLEPESDDGLVNWNYFDSYLEGGKVFPVYKLMQQENIASRLINK